MDFALQHGFKLADLEVHPLRGEVVRPDGLVHIQPKAMEVLVCLAEKTLQTVTRNELIREVWGISTEHDSHADDNLTRCVSELRHALGDSPTDPRYIKTLPRVGYRLVEVPHLIDRSADMAFGYDPYLEDDPPPDSVPNGLDVAGNSAALRHAHGPVTKPGWSIDRILGEMQRRRVFRVAVAFPVIAWGFLEVADLLMEKIVALPEATQTVVMQMLFVFLVLGYSLALYLAWITQLTPAGMRVEPGAHIPAIFQKGRLGWVSGGILMLVVTSIVIAIRFVGSERQAAEACPATIGVMPFANFSPSPSDDYLGRALSEEIAHLLATTGRIKVASRTAAFSLDTTDLSMQDIGERLGVCNVLEGSVRRQGDKLRITAQLIDAGTGYHAWSGTFDRQVSDLFVVHDEISRAVIRALGGSTEGAVQMTLVKHSTSSLDAYEHYLQGRSILAKADDEERMLRADALFRRSLEFDPDYARAWAGRCDANIEMYEFSKSPDWIGTAEQYCRASLELDPTLAEVRVTLAKLLSLDGRREEALVELEKVKVADPRNPDMWRTYAEVYEAQGAMSAAELAWRRALSNSRRDLRIYQKLGAFYFQSGRFDDAVSIYTRMVDVSGGSPAAYTGLGAALSMQGRFSEAAAAYRSAIAMDPNPRTYSNAGTMYFYQGRLSDAEIMMREAVALSPDDYRLVSNLADVLLHVPGGRDEATRLYERAVALAEAVRSVNPGDVEVETMLAHSYGALGEEEEARGAIERAVALGPEQFYVHYFVGLAWLNLGEEDKAIDAFRRAVSLGYPLALLKPDPQLESIRYNDEFRTLTGG